MNNDRELLQKFASNNSEEAFRLLVKRYANLVYSAALRQTSDAHAAEDVTQTVFLLLARKAKTLQPKYLLSGWLFQATRHVCADAAKAVRRQKCRELKAAEWQAIDAEARPVWTGVSPMLDEAIAALSDEDRNSVLIRFFEEKSFIEVGERLGISEEAAKKRVARAIEKLKVFFSRRGVVASSTAVFALLGSHALEAAPSSLTPSIMTALSLQTAGSALAMSALNLKTLPIMASTTFKTTVLTAAFLITIATTAWVTSETVRARLNPDVAASTPPGPPSAEPLVVTNRVVEAFDWRKVDSGDYRTYIANLRKIGCPEETIRDIITGDVNKLFASKQPFPPRNMKLEYWKATNVLDTFLRDENVLKTAAGSRQPEAFSYQRPAGD